MKRSLNNMWQAELHLRLAEPEAALPFEYEALKYLNLAREAERIYTRRLGFEPPPVTEERRLTGELDEVASRERRDDSDPDADAHALAAALYRLLTTTAPDQPLDPAARDLLERSAVDFTRRSTERPALLRHAATLESLAGAERLSVPDCPDCLATLKAATWSLLPPVEPDPSAGRRGMPDALELDYLQALERGATPP